MAANSSAIEAGAPEHKMGRDFPKEQVEQWCETCHQFVLWERERILKRTPSAQERDSHKTSLKWLLRLTRHIYATVADAEFPDRSIADMLRLTLWKLEQSWKAIYEPMPEAEAVGLLKETFQSPADQQLLKRLFPEYG